MDGQEYIEVPVEIAQHFYDYWKLTPPDPAHITGKVFQAFKGGLLGGEAGMKTISVAATWRTNHQIDVPVDWDPATDGWDLVLNEIESNGCELIDWEQTD